MFRLLVSSLTIASLSGCSLLHLDQHHQQTLQHLESIEQNQEQNHIAINSLNTMLMAQDESLTTMKAQIVELQGQINKLKNTHKIANKKKQPKASDITEVPVQPTLPNDVVLGAVEHVVIDNIEHIFEARVDTGAATSSLNAINIEEFERNGKDWVKFQLDEGSHADGDDRWIEAKVVRYVRIRQANNDDTQRRAVVELWVKLGDIHEKAEFTLADRSQMTHPLLLGREFIQDIAVVDVSREFIHSK